MKVTSQQIRVIRQMKQEGETVSAISRTVGLSRPTIYSVLEGGNGEAPRK